MKLHRKWDCHEQALENLAVQSLRREGAFIHTSSPVREGKRGVYPQGWRCFNEKSLFTLKCSALIRPRVVIKGESQAK